MEGCLVLVFDHSVHAPAGRGGVSGRGRGSRISWERLGRDGLSHGSGRRGVGLDGVRTPRPSLPTPHHPARRQASVRSFAYPYGDHSHATAALVAQAGFELACTTQATAVLDGNNPLNYHAFRFVIGTAVDSHAAWPKAFGRDNIG